MNNNQNTLYTVGIVALLAGLAIGFLLPKTPNAELVDKNIAQKNIEKYLLQNQAKVSISNVKNAGPISEIELEIKGQKDTLYSSKDGKIFYQKIADINEIEKAMKKAEAAKTVNTKTDKPKVELFVMSHCPFGTQTEKGYLPAIEKLGDKIDSKVEFVNYVMHPGQGEGQENLLQYCIQETQKDKFNDYLTCFLKKGDTKNCIQKTGIDMKKIEACEKEADKKYAVTENLNNQEKWLNGRYPKFMVQNDLNEKYNVKGSPTLVINGQKVEGIGRDANSIFKAICSAFKNPPKECKEKLDTTTPAPGFGSENNGNNNSAGGCGA